MQARIIFNFAIFSLLQLLFSGCASYGIPTSHFQRATSTSEIHIINEKNALNSPLYKVIPRHRYQPKWYSLAHWSTWILFGNDDDGIFGEGGEKAYRPWQPNTFFKAASWWTRNPFHNLTHYGIGSAERINSEFTLLNCCCRGISALHYDPVAKKNFGCHGPSFFIALHGGKPFISLRLCYPGSYRSEFYIGWRKHGAFGLKFNLLKKERSDSFL